MGILPETTKASVKQEFLDIPTNYLHQMTDAKWNVTFNIFEHFNDKPDLLTSTLY